MAKFSSLKSFFAPYSTIFTISSPYLGFFLALVSLIQPNAGIGGLIGLFFAALYLRLINLCNNPAVIAPVMRNCLLVGLLIGYLFAFNFHIFALYGIFIFLTLITSTAIASIFARSQLPALSIPFCLVGLIIFILLPQIYQFSLAPTILWNLDITGSLPDFAIYFFHAIASLLCFTNPTIGLLFWLGIAFVSPLTALFLWLGFAIGISVESLFHPIHQNLNLFSEGFNYSLVFAAIAGVFLVPSRFSIFMASLATAITAVVIVTCSTMLNPWFLPILSLPFNLVILVVLLSLKTIRPLALNFEFFATPEQNLENSYLSQNRHRLGEIGTFLPVSGTWKIQQAFDGNLTHRGFWRHALDFVATDKNGKIFANKGLDLTDHFSFGKEILSPIEGWIVSCNSSDEDNAIGQIVHGKNWGNYLILKSAFGFYVTLSHLKKDSLVVAVGNFVQVGQKLAECGNSGYSQEPHLHLQVQYQPVIGAATVPFHILNYSIGNQAHFHRTPLQDEIVQNLNLNRAVEKVLTFKLDEILTFEKSDQTRVTIASNVDEITGRFYLTDGISKIYHAKIGANFYFYGLVGNRHSTLWDLMLAAPKIPITYGEKFEYYDELPLILTKKPLQRFFARLKQIAGFKLKNSTAKYSINRQGLEIKGANSLLKIDPALGICEFSVGKEKYVRVFS